MTAVKKVEGVRSDLRTGSVVNLVFCVWIGNVEGKDVMVGVLTEGQCD